MKKNGGGLNLDVFAGKRVKKNEESAISVPHRNGTSFYYISKKEKFWLYVDDNESFHPDVSFHQSIRNNRSKCSLNAFSDVLWK